jgi:hypothetical protein
MDAAPATTPVTPREIRGGRYVLLGPLGQGSQATTWDAVDKREGRAVAVKEFDVKGARSWKDVELAEREARVLSELSHPLLPKYIEHFEQEGSLFLVMEKVHGTPLSTLRKTAPRMGEKDLVRFLHDADQALTYLHGRSPPVVHRDLKPGNVIRRVDGSYAFVDFGAVRDRLRPEGGSTVVGTFGYMAPEQFQGRATPASDVYSIGATALALLTGKEPEDLPHKGLTLDVHAALGSTVKPRLQEALVRMLEPDPDRRATRIGPLLEGTDDRSRDERHPADAWADVGRAAVDVGRVAVDAVQAAVASSRQARRDAKEAARAARREARRARREARRARRRRRMEELPLGVHLLFTVGLALAQVAVALALNVIVPLVLTLLSVVFGKGLRRAAHAVRGAGERAQAALGESREDLRGVRVATSRDAGGPPGVRVQVEPGARERERREDGKEEGGEEGEEGEETEAGDERRAARRRRR